MTSAELKHRAKLQEWAARIQDCRSSGLSVRAWCRQEEINATIDYRWERELLALAETEPCSSVLAVRFAELPAPKQVSRNVAERCATLRIGSASLDIYPGGASAPMPNDFTGADKVYIACGYTDLRKGIDGLARLVQQQFELDPFTNTLFCSADGGETASRACTGKRTASSCCTSDWNRACTSGRALNPR